MALYWMISAHLNSQHLQRESQKEPLEVTRWIRQFIICKEHISLEVDLSLDYFGVGFTEIIVPKFAHIHINPSFCGRYIVP